MKARFVMVVSLSALLFGCLRPPILGNIHCDDRNDCSVASKEFNAVVQHRFLIGSSEAALEKELMGQGFVRPNPPSMTRCRKPDDNSAPVGELYIDCPAWDAKWNPQNHLVHRSSDGWSIICGREFGVLWSSDKQGNLTHVEGYYSVNCL